MKISILRNLRITQRAILFFGFLGLITLSLGLFAMMQLTKLNNAVDALGNKSLPQITLIGELSQILSTGRIETLSYLISVSDNERSIQRHRFNALANQYQTAEHNLSAITTHSDAKRHLQQIAAYQQEYFSQVNHMFDLREQGRQQEADKLLQDRLRPLGGNITRALNELAALERSLAAQEVVSATAIYDRAVWNIIASISAAVAGVFLLAYIFSVSLVSPMRKSVYIAKRIATGDLSQPIQDEGKDEAAEMLQALSQMQEQLRSTIDHIADSSHQLSTTSEELSMVTNEASDIVARQSEQLEQAATAVNELTAAVDEVAHHASTTSSNSEQANIKAKEGQEKLNDTIRIISELAKEVDKTTQSMTDLANNVKNISQVIDVIRAIAEQTNLLALNAAIEAARAGESGRGFAVVADEVRALAHRTQESTKEIERMILTVQEETHDALVNMENSNQWASNTLTMANEMGEALTEITLLISRINEQNLNIASASEEQAMVSREVDKNLISIRDLSFQTSTGANQTRSSSTELAHLAERLDHLIDQFRR